MCHDGAGLRCDRAEAHFLGLRRKTDRRRRPRSDDRGGPGPKLSWKIDQFVLASPFRSWSLAMRKSTLLRVEKRLRPVVPLGRNRVGPLPRNRVVPFRRNQVGPITRNPAIGDVIAEFSLFALGWTLFGSSLYAEYAGDLLLAWLFGIAFQYFAIKPMRNLSVKQGIIAAVKSDTLSIFTFEIGLFGWMALTFFVFFPHPHLRPTQASYWLMMQIGMILGFLTSYPMNRWLIRSGWKEAMG